MMMSIPCECPRCAAANSKEVFEYDLHIFVGNNKANCEENIESFENDLIFESVIYWDVGFCGVARYYIYRDNEFNAIAWYDNEMCQGFKRF